MPAFSVPANLAFDDYDDLTAAIQDWMDRSDLSGSVQAMIALAEARMRRELSPLFTETTASVAVSDGLGGLPSDYGTLIRVMYSDRVLPAYSPATGAYVATSSEPWAYSIEAGQIRLWPETDATVVLLYNPTIPALGADTPTNDLLSQHPDAYFYGSMLFAEGYVANDQRAATFKALWDECIAELKNYLVRQKFAGPLVPRVGFVP